MDTRLLTYFLAVAKEGNVTKAAEALHITQPTLSRQMQDLETMMETSLFDRNKRKITLTEAGYLLKERAEEILDLVDKTRSDIINTRNGLVGDIYLGCAETYALKTVAEVIRDFNQPLIKFHFASGNEESVMGHLDKGLLDIGVVFEPNQRKTYDYLQLPLKNRWGILMRDTHPLALKSEIASEDIMNEPLFVSRQMMENQDLVSWWGEDMERIHIIGTYDLIYNTSLMVMKGVGSALTLDYLVNCGPETGLTFRPLMPAVKGCSYVVWKKGRILSPAAQAFLERIRDKLRRN